jgi:hypothetical protein
VNIFSRVKESVTKAVQRFQEKRTAKKQVKLMRETVQRMTKDAASGVVSSPPKRAKNQTAPSRFNISWELLSGGYVRKKTIKGPAFVPRAEFHHTSRQTCRAYLRDVFFAQFSKQYPNAKRAQRRRVARLAATAEYRRMMGDPTNRISDDDAALAVTA